MRNFTMYIILLMVLLTVSCEEDCFTKNVDVLIQNRSPRQPIAVRLTDSDWQMILPGNTISYRDYYGFENVVLLAFTSDECEECWEKIKKGITHDAGVMPKYELLKFFEFDPQRPCPEKNRPAIIIHAVEKKKSLNGGIELIDFEIVE